MRSHVISGGCVTILANNFLGEEVCNLHVSSDWGVNCLTLQLLFWALCWDGRVRGSSLCTEALCENSCPANLLNLQGTCYHVLSHWDIWACLLQIKWQMSKEWYCFPVNLDSALFFFFLKLTLWSFGTLLFKTNHLQNTLQLLWRTQISFIHYLDIFIEYIPRTRLQTLWIKWEYKSLSLSPHGTWQSSHWKGCTANR